MKIARLSNRSASSTSVVRRNRAVVLWLALSVTLSLLLPASRAAAQSNVWQATDLATGSDNKTHLLWLRPDNAFSLWTLGDNNAILSQPFYEAVGGGWSPRSLAAGGDGRMRLMFTNSDGRMSLWTLDSNGQKESNTPAYGPYAGWTATDVAVGTDNILRVLWTHSDNSFSTWTIGPSYNPTNGPPYQFNGWQAGAAGVSGSSTGRLLVNNINGQSSIWTLDAANQFVGSTPAYGPYSGWTPRHMAASPAENAPRLLWTRSDDAFSLWNISDPNNPAITPAMGPFLAGSERWIARAISVGGDNKTRLLFNRTDGAASVWTLSTAGQQEGSTPAYGPYSASPPPTPTPTPTTVPTPTPVPNTAPKIDVLFQVGDNLSDDFYFPDAQDKPLNTAAGTPAVYPFMVQNEGNGTEKLRVQGRGDTPGWKVRYFDAPTGGNDISAQVKGGGYLVIGVPAGAMVQLRVEVTPDASVAQNQLKTVAITATSQTNSSITDQVTVTTTKSDAPPAPAYQPDALIRLASEVSYQGENVFAEEQLSGTTASPGVPAVFNVKIINRGSKADTFMVVADAVPETWKAAYFDRLDNGTNITPQVVGSGWQTPTLQPGGFVELRVEIEPLDANTTDEPYISIAATSSSDTSKSDAVQADAWLGTATPPEVTFTGTTRACAGGLSDALHTLTLTAHGQANAPYFFSFENNTGHNYGTATAANVPHRAKLKKSNDPNAVWQENATITTGADGTVSLSVLSSDVISQPRLIARTSAAQTSVLGSVQCDFAAVTSRRDAPDPVDPDSPAAEWQANDTGWTCDMGQLEKPDDQTSAKVYLRFKRPDENPQTVSGQLVSGHALRVRIYKVVLWDGTEVWDTDEIKRYVTLVDSAGAATAQIDAVTTNGVAQVTVKASQGVNDIGSIVFAAVDLSQWVN